MHRGLCKIQGMIGTLLITVCLVLPAVTHAASNCSWTTGTPADWYWDTATNWSGGAVPAEGDTALLRFSDTKERTILYKNTANPFLQQLTIDNTGGGKTTLKQTKDSLFVDTEYIGDTRTGEFWQTGGANTTYALWIGNNYDSSGYYILEGGTLTAGWQNYTNHPGEMIGNHGTGTFTQKGGDNNILENLYMGGSSTGNGTYNLEGGCLKVDTGKSYIGLQGRGAFNQTGGSYSSTNIYLASGADSIGTYELSGSGSTLYAGENMYVGYAGKGSATQSGGTFTQSGGTATIHDYLYLGHEAESSGTLKLSGGTLKTTQECVAGGYSSTASVEQTGSSTHIVTGDLFVGYGQNSNGTFTLADTAQLTAGRVVVGEGASGATGVFNQQGSSQHTTGTLLLGQGLGGTGQYNLSGGKLTVNGEAIVGSAAGTGTFIQSGGENTVGTLTVGKGSSGRYELQCGTLTTESETIGESNTGQFIQSGGKHVIYKPSMPGYSNLLIGDGPGSSGTYRMSGGSLDVTGLIEVGRNGSGALQVLQGTVRAGEMKVGANGYLQFAAGTSLRVEGNFECYKDPGAGTSSWDTDEAALIFGTSSLNQHTFFINGTDKGSDYLTGFTNNYVWGSLMIEQGILYLSDLSPVDGAALYVKELNGLNLSGGAITNISSAYNIYYLTANGQDLGDIRLTGGGSLIHATGTPVPLPAGVWLFGSGLLGLLGLRKRSARIQ